MKNYGEYFTTNMVLLTILGMVIMPGVADTWYEGTKYVFRATSMTCFFICFMASTWAFGFLILMDCVNAKK